MRLVPDERHFESINIWRSAIPETVFTMPLALCDMRSAAERDIVFGVVVSVPTQVESWTGS